MTILSAQTLRKIKPLSPFKEKYIDSNGCSCGLSVAGYDITLDHDVCVKANGFSLVAAEQHFEMPDDVLAVVHDKSSLARKGIAVQNTVIEPGWRGYLTMEITNHTDKDMWLYQGNAIAQVLFHRLDEPADPYAGKYQDQGRGVQLPLKEDGSPL